MAKVVEGLIELNMPIFDGYMIWCVTGQLTFAHREVACLDGAYKLLIGMTSTEPMAIADKGERAVVLGAAWITQSDTVSDNGTKVF